ncbi:DUF1631 family protein [Lysobacter sp. SG-8]|uniref:DUF1631 family protein n=1 Tax=Marilutibacter penaei TaxID=2759900 RepID=A0A7W3U5N9_9GAMM|nr:DUF1631 family protein [Lysobacter penaei]MBB1089120.1 DUF1631 family protein [Lysobacter penaei]
MRNRPRQLLSIPRRSRHAMDQVLDRLLADLKPELDAIIDQLDVVVARRAREERDDAMLAQWVDTRQALARHRDAFQPAFADALRQSCTLAHDHASPASSPGLPDGALQPLMLLDEAIVDEDNTLGSIAARHAARASLPLMLLGHRFAVLLERPPARRGVAADRTTGLLPCPA